MPNSQATSAKPTYEQLEAKVTELERLLNKSLEFIDVQSECWKAKAEVVNASKRLLEASTEGTWATLVPVRAMDDLNEALNLIPPDGLAKAHRFLSRFDKSLLIISITHQP